MAFEDAKRDANRVPGLLVHDVTGAETRRVNLTANGGIPVDVLAGSTAGTQYTEGDTDATITGTAALMEVAANTLQPIQGTVADGQLVNLGTNNDVAQSGTWTVQPGNTANTTPWLTTESPATAGGLSLFRSLDLDETEEEIKASAGQVYGMWFTNTATTTRFLKFYNATAANVTVGTTTPVLTLGLPGNTSDDISGVFSSTIGIAFDTAITVAATTGIADNDTGAPAANDVLVNIFYK